MDVTCGLHGEQSLTTYHVRTDSRRINQRCFSFEHKYHSSNTLLCRMLPNRNAYIRFYSNPIFKYSSFFLKSITRLTRNMETGEKRMHESEKTPEDQPVSKCLKLLEGESWYSNMTHGKGRPIPKHIFDKFTEDDIKLLETVKTSCTDLELLMKALKFRKSHRLTIRLPEDYDCSSYYIEDGLRKVYPYPYLYQSYAKRRWLGRRLMDVLKQEFRDISDDQLKLRFDMRRVLVNGEPVDHLYKIKDNDFLANRNHRHELPVLATPIRKIYEDKEILVIDKPPSVPIHPCGRYRFNTVISILEKEYHYNNVKVVHRLDRLVSGVLIIARNKTRARKLEEMIHNRDVQKEYVCRVVGDFPEGDCEDDGFITVDQPLDIVPGKIGITVVHPEGKQSLTRFKKLNYNGKTSAVLCQPKTGRMHQIRVHLQYLGHPIVNDSLYNCDSFGPERGKGARFGKPLRQLSHDVIAKHRASTWMMSEDNDIIDYPTTTHENQVPFETGEQAKTEEISETSRFLSNEEKEETLAALEHFFTNESWKDLERKWQYDPLKDAKDPNCRDCQSNYLDPPLRRMFLYLHALRYSGTGWCYESDMPVWARDTWKY